MATPLLPPVINSVLQSAWINKSPTPFQKEPHSHLIVFGKKDRVKLTQLLKKDLDQWQLDRCHQPDSIIRVEAQGGPVWVVNLWAEAHLNRSPRDINDASDYSIARDSLGTTYVSILSEKCHSINICFVNCRSEQVTGGLVGIEISQYKYKNFLNPSKKPLYINKLGGQITNGEITKASALGVSVNIARHLVNVPPSQLNPKIYAATVRSLFREQKAIRAEVWGENRLKKEGMGLLIGVGQGASHKSCMVHIKYRPAGAKGKPIAFVGKGLTFDTGGLNLKPASGMRLMKKDMGGSAAIVGLAYWACHSGIKKKLDFYLAIAENSVSDGSIRPSDILTARNGMTVEVHNTDAEGRLALADALDVAVSKKDRPRYVIDVATLTGAVKVALGSGVGGLFGNSHKLMDDIYQSSVESGDPMWPMPLIQSYRSKLSSKFADISNCTDGFGGAITAALFLESFVGDVLWAHLDIYAWNDGPKGALQEVGGSGQAVQCLSRWLS